MFVVQVRGRFSKPHNEYFLNSKGRKTAFLGQADTFPTEEAAKVAGDKFVAEGRGYHYTVDPA